MPVALQSLKRPRRKLAPPPKHLEAPERAMWRGIVERHAFADEASLALLRATMESHQRARRCREIVDREGETIRDRFNQLKPHPLLAAERDARAGFISGIRALNLDLTE